MQVGNRSNLTTDLTINICITCFKSIQLHVLFISLHGKIWTQQVDLAPNVWLHSSVGRASHCYRRGHGFDYCWSPDIFRASSFQLFKLENLLQWSLFTFNYMYTHKNLLIECVSLGYCTLLFWLFRLNNWINTLFAHATSAKFVFYVLRQAGGFYLTFLNRNLWSYETHTLQWWWCPQCRHESSCQWWVQGSRGTHGMSLIQGERARCLLSVNLFDGMASVQMEKWASLIKDDFLSQSMERVKFSLLRIMFLKNNSIAIIT